MHVQGEANQNTDGYDTKLLWQPTTNFKVTLAGDWYFKDDANGNQNVDITPGVADGYLRSENSAGTGYTFPAAATGFGVLAPIVVPATPVLNTADLGTLPREQGTSKKWQVAVGDQPLQELHEWGASLTPIWNTPWADVTSITAYRANHSLLYASLCACSIPQGTAVVDIHRQYYYQEIRAVSNTEGPLHWLAGATFLNDHFTSDTVVRILYPLINLHTAHAYDLVQNWTAYAQVGYDFWDNFNLTASLRWEHERNWARFPSIPPVQVAGTANAGLDKLIPSATLNYKLDDGTAWIRWARGVKSGGVNPVASPGIFEVFNVPLSDGSVFGPEKVDTYEAGYKQSLLNHTLQVSGDIFYNKYNGLQESAHATPAFQSIVILAIVNAGSARTYGAEATVNWQALDSLQLGANAGYLDAKYSTFSYGFPVPATPILIPTNLSHTQMPSAPRWQLSFTADYDQPITARWNVVGNLVESHLSTQLFDQSVLPPGGKLYGLSIPNAVGPGYWITNLKVGVKTNDDVYRLEAFAQNLFDQKYYTFGSSEASSGTLLSWGNPRVVGVEFDATW
jgi:iron complex outermembrane receptor protein